MAIKRRVNTKATTRSPLDRKPLQEFKDKFVEEYVTKSHNLPRPDQLGYDPRFEKFVRDFVSKRSTIKVDSIEEAYRHGISLLQAARKSGKLTKRIAPMMPKASVVKSKSKPKASVPTKSKPKASVPTKAEIEAAKKQIRNERSSSRTVSASTTALAEAVSRPARRRNA